MSNSVPLTLSRLRAMRREELQREREAVGKFVEGARRGDLELFAEGLNGALECYAHRRLWSAAAKLGPVQHYFLRGFFAEFWMDHGDSIRTEAPDQLILLDALWCLMPRYDGPDLTLYRGESFDNRRRRTYGACWTTRREVAEAFALGRREVYSDGTVLLETIAPARSIISAPHSVVDIYDETEYVVDRRKLGQVRVIERFAGLPGTA